MDRRRCCRRFFEFCARPALSAGNDVLVIYALAWKMMDRIDSSLPLHFEAGVLRVRPGAPGLRRWIDDDLYCFIILLLHIDSVRVCFFESFITQESNLDQIEAR